MKRYGLFMAYNHVYKIIDITDCVKAEVKYYTSKWKIAQAESIQDINYVNYFIFTDGISLKLDLKQISNSLDKLSIQALSIRQEYFNKLRSNRNHTDKQKEATEIAFKVEVNRIQKKLDKLALRYPEEFL